MKQALPFTAAIVLSLPVLTHAHYLWVTVRPEGEVRGRGDIRATVRWEGGQAPIAIAWSYGGATASYGSDDAVA